MSLSEKDLECLSEDELRRILVSVVEEADEATTKRPLTYKFTPDDPVLELRDKLPTLEFSKELSHLPDDGSVTHRLLIGDNYHALAGLRASAATHVETRGGVYDIIYIDPPYNTGRKDMVYNDKFLDENSTYRHTKWMSFMEPRLRMSYDLLKEDGVIMVAIGRQEVARLRLILDSIFGEDNFIEEVTWKAGKHNDAHLVSSSTDYMLLYAKNMTSLLRKGDWRSRDIELSRYFTAANDAWVSTSDITDVEQRRESARKKFVSVVRSDFKKAGTVLKSFNRFDENGRLYSSDGGNVSFPGGNGYVYDVIHPVTGKIVSPPPGGYRYVESTLRQMVSEGLIEFGKDHTTQIKKRRFEYEGEVMENFIDKPRTAANKHLKSILGPNVFEHPKDHHVLAEWFNLIGGNNAKILDFFGGSGTTAEAVLFLNSVDGGRREVTIAVDDFNSIGTSTTRERIVRVMTGEGWADGSAHEGYGGQLTVHYVGTAPMISDTFEDVYHPWSRHAAAWGAYIRTPVEVSDDGTNLILSDGNGTESLAVYCDNDIDEDAVEKFYNEHPDSDVYVIATVSGYSYVELFDGTSPFTPLPEVQVKTVRRATSDAFLSSGERLFEDKIRPALDRARRRAES